MWKLFDKKKRSGLICISLSCLQGHFWSRLQMVKTSDNTFLLFFLFFVFFLHFKRCCKRWYQQRIVKCHVYLHIFAFHYRWAFLFSSVCGFGASIFYAAPQEELSFSFLYTYLLCSLSEWLACEKEYVDVFFPSLISLLFCKTLLKCDCDGNKYMKQWGNKFSIFMQWLFILFKAMFHNKDVRIYMSYLCPLKMHLNIIYINAQGYSCYYCHLADVVVKLHI